MWHHTQNKAARAGGFWSKWSLLLNVCAQLTRTGPRNIFGILRAQKQYKPRYPLPLKDLKRCSALLRDEWKLKAKSSGEELSDKACCWVLTWVKIREKPIVKVHWLTLETPLKGGLFSESTTKDTKSVCTMSLDKHSITTFTNFSPKWVEKLYWKKKSIQVLTQTYRKFCSCMCSRTLNTQILLQYVLESLFFLPGRTDPNQPTITSKYGMGFYEQADNSLSGRFSFQ